MTITKKHNAYPNFFDQKDDPPTDQDLQDREIKLFLESYDGGINFLLWLGVLTPLFLLVTIPPITATDFTEMFTFCVNNNMTIQECVTFWSLIESQCNETQVVQTCENHTIIENRTIYADSNCSSTIDYQSKLWAHQEEMSRIEKGALDCISQSDCDLQISDAVSSKDPPRIIEESTQPSSTFLFYGLIGAAVLLGGYIYVKKFKSPSSISDSTYSPPVEHLPNTLINKTKDKPDQDRGEDVKKEDNIF